ncbi:MAG TPA: RDD family protein [Rariglobus sp.]|jgi:uncharacterized RDD family membrane protein YckC|nr:RDD family protein [Rariglobus sp.]
MKQYHTFWRRAGALLLDGLVFAPLTAAPIVIMTISHGISFAAYLGLSLFTTVTMGTYFIVMPARYGQTLGKMATGVRIVKTDGGAIGLKESFVRWLPGFLIGLIISIPTFFWLSSLPAIDMASMTTLPKWVNWINTAWLLAEIITLLCNPHRRAIHDFVAGTEVIVIKALPSAENPTPALATA